MAVTEWTGGLWDGWFGPVPWAFSGESMRDRVKYYFHI